MRHGVDECVNDCVADQETSRRLLHFSVPRVVAVSPHMRLVEDNPASLSLLDIYKQVIISSSSH